MILYLHGFASSPNSAKVRAIRDLLAPDIEMNVPDLNVPSFETLDIYAAVERAIEAGKRVPPVAVVGSSLGGLMALEIVRRGLRRPLVLIAPALGVAEHWINHVPEGDPVIVYNHAREADAPIHRAFFEQMAGVDADRESPAVPVTLIMGRKDESVPFDRVAAVWRQWEQQGLAGGSKFVEIAEGDHGLTAFAPTIAEEIRRISV
jgi:pimeloyl-ACP methyl ester carboxylesterase